MDKKLLKEIRDFCILNNIQDIDKTIDDCLRKGFYILKYGLSPIDNYKIENNVYDTENKERNSPKEIEAFNATVQRSSDDKENGRREKEKSIGQVVKRKIRIIKKEIKDD